VTWDEAYAIGVRRCGAANRRGAKHRYDYDPLPAKEQHWHGMSAVSEWTVAELTGRRWISMGDRPDRPGEGDVEGGLQVRWTDRPDGSLIVHRDEPEPFFVLVVGPAAPLRVVGWVTREVGQQERWWRADVRKPAFFVPQGAGVLNEMDTLPPIPDTSCWTCANQQIGGDTFLGLCKWFERIGQTKKPIPPNVVDVGCKKWGARLLGLLKKSDAAAL
jgi:hypothetical protein